MAQINFVEQMLAFHRYSISNNIRSNERLLWYELFFLFNDLAHGNEWPDGMVSISNKQLLGSLPYGEDSLLRARKNLAKQGLIQFKPGRKNKLCPHYQLVYFPSRKASYPQPVDKVPIWAGNPLDNMSGNAAYNISSNTQRNTQVIPLNQRELQTDSHTDCCYDNAWRTSARVRNAVAQRIISQWGGDRTGGDDIHFDLVDYMERGMTPEAITGVMNGCEHGYWVRNHLHSAALELGIDQESDAPFGY